MASGGKDIPQELKEEYERVMALTTERGRSTGKLRDMQRLCNHFYLASTDEGASLQRQNWKSPYIKENALWRKEEIVEENDETFTWGHIVGSHLAKLTPTKRLQDEM